MFAVIKTGGRQYRVAPDDVLEIGKIAGDVGTIVQLGEVLLVGGESTILGSPIPGASVAAEVLDHKRGPKVIAFKKRRRKNSRRKRGYRDEITVLRITEILTNDNKPTIGPRPKREKVVAKPADDGDEAPKAAEKAAPKKPAAKKAAAKAPAKDKVKADAKKAPAKKAAAKGKSTK
jgi:large subunit ribosomal protein L21